MSQTFDAVVAYAQQEQQKRLPAGPKKPVKAIGLIPGDGIGPLLMTQATRVLTRLLQAQLAAKTLELVPITGMSQAERAQAGSDMPQAVLSQLRQLPVVLKGPLAAAPGQTSPNAGMRRALDLYVNLRPIALDAARQWHFFRENLEGPYLLGGKGLQVDDDLAIDFVVQTHSQTRRLAKTACEYAVARGLTQVAVVTKANIVKLTDGNFLADCQAVAAAYPQLTVTPYHIDALAAKLHDPEFGRQLQVVILPNLYGDIVTDIAAELQGGLGTAGAGNLGDQYAVFEAIHGTAPYLISHGLAAYADPRSLLRAVEMLLRHIGAVAAAKRLGLAMNASDLPEPGAQQQVTTAAYVDALLAHLD
ncbi:isocitrate/isopropylmalate family dehydrogenase [Lacticaseibacillus baoqingensis]|uniref:Isocitrate/isopropylmalate family dehydrogenase n=1 Tax=Lacticaseibacillus baoqingensis TaxID=2486013 RepID=A0ABW4E7B2_9LACO|nr:isocitrate/isopropylmalate family dehydrogenase [Lacticaseibacillus baoqingensis]